MQILNVFILTEILDSKMPTEINWVSDQPWPMPDESEESLRLDSARLETIQLLKDVKSLLVLEQEVTASRKAVDSAQKVTIRIPS